MPGDSGRGSRGRGGGGRGGAGRGGRGGGRGGFGKGRSDKGANNKPKFDGNKGKYSDPNAPKPFDRKKYLADKIEQGVDVNTKKLQRNNRVRDTARFLDPLNKQAQFQGKNNEPKKTATDTMIDQAKAISEQVRIKSVPPEKRKPYINKIMYLLNGKFVQVALRPDASRIIQLCLKHGTDEQKDTIFSELSPAIPQLIVHEYSHFLIPKMLKYGSKEASKSIIDGLKGQVRGLIRKKFAAEVIEYVFDKRATPNQQLALISEFYGREYSVFKDTYTLDKILELNPGKKASIISFFSEAMMSLLSEKAEVVIHYSIVHRLLLNFFNHALPRPSLEMVDLLKDHIISIVHTQDGARVVVRCFTLGTPEQRKLMLQSMKDHILQICEDSYGYAVVLRALQVVDNASVLEKYILQYLGANLMTVITHEVAVNILLFILNDSATPYRNVRSYVARLLEAEPKTQPSAEDPKQQIPICQKAMEVKRKETLKYLYPQILEICINQLDRIARSLWGTRILFLIIKHDIEGAAELISAILGTIVGPEEYDPRINKGAAHPLNDFNFSRFICQLICDPELQEQGFARSFYKLVSPYVHAWAMLPGSSHVILDLLKTSKPDIRKEMMTKLSKLKADDAVPGTKLILQYMADPNAPTKTFSKKRAADHDVETQSKNNRVSGSASKARKTDNVEQTNNVVEPSSSEEEEATVPPAKPVATPKSTPAKSKSQTPAAKKPQTPVARSDVSQSKSSTPAAPAHKTGKHLPEEGSAPPTSAPKSTPAQQKRQSSASKAEPAPHMEESEEELDLDAHVVEDEQEEDHQKGVTFAEQQSDDEDEDQDVNTEQSNAAQDDENEAEEEPEEAPVPVKTPAKRGARKLMVNLSPSTPARNLRSRTKPVVESESESEDEDEAPAPKPTPAKRGRPASVKATPSAKANPAARATPGRRAKRPAEESEEELEENSPPKRARQQREESEEATPAKRGRKSLATTTPGRKSLSTTTPAKTPSSRRKSRN